MKFSPEDFWGIKQDTTIRVGDRVKVVNASGSYRLALGKTGVVTETFRGAITGCTFYRVKFDDESFIDEYNQKRETSESTLAFYEHELELIP